MAAMISPQSLVRPPPGLHCNSEPETATHSRERRRVALAAKTAVQELQHLLSERFITIENKLNKVMAEIARIDASEADARLSRLEALHVCTAPSVDEVVNQMLSSPNKSFSKDGKPLDFREKGKIAPPIPQFPFDTDEDQSRLNAEFFDIGELSHVATQTEISQRGNATLPKILAFPLPIETTSVDNYAQTEANEHAFELHVGHRGTQTELLCKDEASVCSTAPQTDEAGYCHGSIVDATIAESFQQLVGEWIAIDMLRTGDFIKVVAPFVDATVGIQVQLTANMLGKVIRIDAEGDAEVRFPGLTELYARERSRWVLSSSFDNIV